MLPMKRKFQSISKEEKKKELLWYCNKFLRKCQQIDARHAAGKKTHPNKESCEKQCTSIDEGGLILPLQQRIADMVPGTDLRITRELKTRLPPPNVLVMLGKKLSKLKFPKALKDDAIEAFKKLQKNDFVTEDNRSQAQLVLSKLFYKHMNTLVRDRLDRKYYYNDERPAQSKGVALLTSLFNGLGAASQRNKPRIDRLVNALTSKSHPRIVLSLVPALLNISNAQVDYNPQIMQVLQYLLGFAQTSRQEAQARPGYMEWHQMRFLFRNIFGYHYGLLNSVLDGSVSSEAALKILTRFPQFGANRTQIDLDKYLKKYRDTLDQDYVDFLIKGLDVFVVYSWTELQKYASLGAPMPKIFWTLDVEEVEEEDEKDALSLFQKIKTAHSFGVNIRLGFINNVVGFLKEYEEIARFMLRNVYRTFEKFVEATVEEQEEFLESELDEAETLSTLAKIFDLKEVDTWKEMQLEEDK